MDKNEIIRQTTAFIAREFASEGSGHDWFHVDRVRRLALHIGQVENCDPFIVEMAALLHDLDDWKISGSSSHTQTKAHAWLVEMAVEADTAADILKVIDEVSFRGAGTGTPVGSREGAVVQDADRLDAMGAIGIARTFAFGGHKNRLIYDPAIAPVMHADFKAYQNSSAPTLNHFFEKLLLLKDRIQTPTGKLMADQRHRFMEQYLEQFFNEWNDHKI